MGTRRDVFAVLMNASPLGIAAIESHDPNRNSHPTNNARPWTMATTIFDPLISNRFGESILELTVKF